MTIYTVSDPSEGGCCIAVDTDLDRLKSMLQKEYAIVPEIFYIEKWQLTDEEEGFVYLGEVEL